MNNYFPWVFHDKSFIFHVKIPQLMQSLMPKSQLCYNAYWNVSSYERIKWHPCQFLYMVMLEGPLTSGSMKQTGIATVYVNKCSNLNKSYTIYHYSLPLITLLILFLHNRRVVITIQCCIIDSLGKCFKWLLVWKIKWQVYTVRMRGALRCIIIVSFEGNPFKRQWASTWWVHITRSTQRSGLAATATRWRVCCLTVKSHSSITPTGGSYLWRL